MGKKTEEMREKIIKGRRRVEEMDGKKCYKGRKGKIESK